ncbi:oxidoreductase,short chain dehydrogenase-like protein [Pyrenochaeta sp. MPI-SDFR-AT-0127]|nr:oxidoreductase,short chain dehydrogenase-like protein [Pyrenochaeta sp. MPI-SDFR-AT-0127]
MSSQVWLITGTTSGFGAEFVKKLLAKGDKVIATARDTSKIEHLKNASVSILKLDLFSEQAVLDQVAADAVAIHGHVDVVVNNAGYSHFGILEDDTREDWIKQYQTHVFGTLGVARAFLPYFRARRAGTLVFMGSTAAWGGMPTLAAYCGSKSALRGAVETLGIETKPFGIRTLLVEPGFFRTNLLDENNVKYVDTKIDDYKPVTDTLFATFKSYDQKQPGDPGKGVERVIDTVKGENDAAGKEFPISLALGSDAVEHIRKNCLENLRLLDEWEAVSSNTNFE